MLYICAINNFKKRISMKNLFLVPTEKPSRLVRIYSDSERNNFTLKLDAEVNDSFKEYLNIYITSDEEIKDCWVLNTKRNEFYFCKDYFGIQPNLKKIILTTDPDLIADGVQSIDDEFLEWFVKNPSCEFVQSSDSSKDGFYNSLFIPQEEPKHSKVFSENGNQLLFDKQGNLIKQEHNPFELPEVLPDVMFYESLQETKQETLEEAAEKYENSFKESDGTESVDFIEGAKWQAEQIPSIIEKYLETAFISKEQGYMNPKNWFEQFKKK